MARRASRRRPEWCSATTTGGDDPHDQYAPRSTSECSTPPSAPSSCSASTSASASASYRRPAGGAGTVDELAAAAGIAPRYAQEWLEQQAVAGVLTVDDVSAPAGARRYHLPEAHVGIVADPLALDHLAPLAGLVVGIAATLDDVADAYRTGGGVPYARYGADFRRAQGAINRPAFTSALVDEWLPALGPAVVERLAAGGRLADLGCGAGLVHGRGGACLPERRGVGHRQRPGVDRRGEGGGRRTRAWRFASSAPTPPRWWPPARSTWSPSWRRCTTWPGRWRSWPRPAPPWPPTGSCWWPTRRWPGVHRPGDDLERMMYGWSITHCLPAAMAEQPSAAIGTVIRESTVRDLAGQAGFSAVDVLDVDGGFFRLYALRP